MACIVFYDTTDLDKQQLTAAMSETDHYCEFVDDTISTTNLNPDAEIISVFVSSTVTRAMIEAMPKLTLICCRSTGYNNIDFEAVKERGITVVNVPTYGDVTVAEFAFTLLLAITRKMEAVLATEHQQFRLPELTGTDLAGKTFGVIGCGHIGQKALKIANGFSMRTLAYDPYPNDELAAELGFSYVSLEELLADSDVISLHVPYNPHTHHLLNRDRIFSMKPGAILLNTARGALVENSALVEALDAGHLGGAGLDVLEGEKLLNYEDQMTLIQSGGETSVDMFRHSVEISALKQMPNVIVAPHNAFNTTEAIGRINGTTVENIIGFYNGDIPHKIEPKPVTPGKLVLLRHTESVWNACGVWSGVTDIPLSEKGQYDCTPVGQTVLNLGFPIDVAIHTEQVRTRKTLEGIIDTSDIEPEIALEPGFNERNYGEYTGMDKWKVKEALGEEKFNDIRRGWDVPFPHGETLKQVYERVAPAYEHTVLPRLRAGQNVLIVAHGNSLRALMKHLESISDDDIPNIEMLMDEVVIYDIDPASGLCQHVERKKTGITVEAKF